MDDEKKENAMSQVGQVGRPAVQQEMGVTAPRVATEAPAELRGARLSSGRRALRVVLGIFTLGISEGVLALVRHAREGQVPQPRVAAAGLPAAPPRADVFNKEIADGLHDNKIPATFQAAVGEALEQLRNRFGAEYVPQDASLATLPQGRELCHTLGLALKRMPDELSPQVLRAQVEEKGVQLIARQAMQSRVAACCAEIGYDAGRPGLISSAFLSKNPALLEELQSCANLEEMNRVIDANMDSIRDNIALRQEIHTAETEAKNSVITNLARATGLNEDSVRARLDLKKLEDSFAYLGTDLLSGAKSLRGDALSEAFNGIADKFVRNKAELFASVDRLGLPPQISDEWKECVLTQRTLSKGDMFAVWHGIGSGMNIGNSLLTVLNAPAEAFSDREILGLVESLGAKLTDALFAHYGPQGWAELGGDGQGDARYYAGQAMLAAHPELMEALSARPELVSRLMGMCGDDIGASMEAQMTSTLNEAAVQQKRAAETAQAILLGVPRSATEYNRELAASLGTADMPVFHGQALEQAVADMRARYGDDCLPAGNLAQALNGRDPVAGGERLSILMAAAIRGAATPITSGEIASLFEGIGRSAAAYGAFQGILSGMAREAGLQVNEEGIRWISSMLRKRHPDLLLLITGAESRADVKALIDTLPEVASLLRIEHDIQSAWDNGIETVRAGMAAATGLSREDVEAQLNLSPMTDGRFSYMRKDIRDLYGDPETGLDDLPGSRRIQEDFRGIADSFLAGKRGLYTSVDELGLSPELTTRWKAEVLTNPTLRKSDFLRRSVDIARAMTDAGLTALLGESGISEEQILGNLLSIGMQKEVRAHVVYTPAELDDMGSDEYSVINSTVSEAFLDLHPGMVTAMQADRERMRAVFSLGEDRMIEIQHQMNVVRHNSPQWAELQAEYAALGMVCGIILAVIGSE